MQTIGDTPALHVETLVRLLDGIDRLAAGATGAFVFTKTDAPQGTILVEDNRICWAAASNMGERLTDLLIRQTHPPLDRSTLDTVFHECRQDGSPLGETLVERGLISADGLRRALLQHTAEAIALLSETPTVSPVWVSNRSTHYDARFSFGTTDLFTRIGASYASRAGDPDDATETLVKTAQPGAVALVFSLSTGLPIPVATRGIETANCKTLAELGKRALGSFRNSSEDLVILQTAPKFAYARRVGSWVCAEWCGNRDPLNVLKAASL